MGRRKTTLKIPKVATVMCPHCSKKQRIEVSMDKGVPSLVCKHCEQEIRTPLAQCCVVCAFSDKKCPYSLKMHAYAKGLALR